MKFSRCINQGCLYFGKECIRHKAEGESIDFKHVCKEDDFILKILDKNYVRELDDSVEDDEECNAEEVKDEVL